MIFDKYHGFERIFSFQECCLRDAGFQKNSALIKVPGENPGTLLWMNRWKAAENTVEWFWYDVQGEMNRIATLTIRWNPAR